MSITISIISSLKNSGGGPATIRTMCRTRDAEPLGDGDRDQEVGEGDAAVAGRRAVESGDGERQGCSTTSGSPGGSDRGTESSISPRPGGLFVGDGADDRDPRGDPGGIGGRQHRQRHAEHDGEPITRPRDRRTRRPSSRRPGRPSAPPTRSPATIPRTAPDDPDDRRPRRRPIRQTWRRVIPAARRTPISRTRSMTLIVRVLTIPSAATMTATSARASNSPNTRPSASSMAPWTARAGSASSASCAAGPRAPRAAGGGAGLVADGEGVGAGDAELPGRVVPADEDRLAAVPGQRPLGDAGDAQVERPARRASATLSVVADGRAPSRSARRAGRIAAAAGVEAREGRVPVAAHEREPAVGGEVGADDRGRVDRDRRRGRRRTWRSG